MRTLLAAVVGTLLGATAASAEETPTFYRDVLPILQTNCQTCHRQGEVAPMSLVTYEQARPWALAIKKATQSRAMPPWFAEPGITRYANEHEKVLSENALDTLARWADGGAPAGDPATAPPARVFPSGWNITPDVVVEMPKPFEMPARGTINYKYMLVKTDFKEDMWVVAAEMRPGNSQVLHHGKVWVRPPGSKWMERRGAWRGVRDRNAAPHSRTQRGRGRQRHPRQVQSRPGAPAVRPSGRREVHPEGFRPRVRAALHDHGHAHDRCLEGRLRAGEEPARHALLLPRRADGAESRHSRRRRLGRSRERDHAR